MTIGEKLDRKQRLLDDQGKQLREQAEIGSRLDRELKALQDTLTSGEPVDTVEIEKQVLALAEKVKTQGERLKDLDALNETPFEVPPEDTGFVVEGYPIPSLFLKFFFETNLHVSGMFTVCTDKKNKRPVHHDNRRSLY